MKKIIQTTAGLQEVDSNFNPEYFNSEEMQEIRRQEKISALRDEIKTVPNINKLNTELNSMINQINANVFSADDIIPAIKKIAESQKAILDMVMNL